MKGNEHFVNYEDSVEFFLQEMSFFDMCNEWRVMCDASAT